MAREKKATPSKSNNCTSLDGEQQRWQYGALAAKKASLSHLTTDTEAEQAVFTPALFATLSAPDYKPWAIWIN